ncbi:hypothetical protein D9M72_582290 [compost metagenome]
MILQVHPGHPLAAVAERATQPQSERRQQTLEEAAVARQHQAGAHQHHADAKGFGPLRGLFPGHAELAGEVIGDGR